MVPEYYRILKSKLEDIGYLTDDTWKCTGTRLHIRIRNERVKSPNFLVG